MDTIEKDFMGVVSSYTESIKKNLAEGEWDDLNSLLKNRQQALEDFFSKRGLLENKEKIVEVIKKIRAEDAEFLSLVQSKKQEKEKQFTSFKKGQESVKAYQAF